MTYLSKNAQEKIKEKFFKKQKSAHDWDHTKRVLNLCLHIGKKEKANLAVLEYAALLHDIAREKEDDSKGKIYHATQSAINAQQIIKKTKLTPEQKKT